MVAKKARVKKRRGADVGDRVIIRGTPARGVVHGRIDNVVLVFRDDTDGAVLHHIREIEVISKAAT